MVTTVDLEEFEQGQQELERLLARDRLRIIVARAETTEFNNISAGSFTEVGIPWTRAGDISRIAVASLIRVVVVQTAGTATGFDLQIRTKAGGTNLDVVYSVTGASGTHDAIFAVPIPYLSEETDADRYKIFLAIKPATNPGTYIARIYASPLR